MTLTIRRNDARPIHSRQSQGPRPRDGGDAHRQHADNSGDQRTAASARRFRGSGATQKYVAVYHLASPGVPQSDAWKKAADTPWTIKMRPHFTDRFRFEGKAYLRAQ